MTAEAETVHVRVWQDGVEALDRHFRAPRRGDADLLAEAIETGRRDPVSVGALRAAAALIGAGGRARERTGGRRRRRRGTRRPPRPPNGSRRPWSTPSTTRGRADWVTTGGSALVARSTGASPRSRCGDDDPVGRRPRLVDRRSLRAARPPAFERRSRSTTSCSISPTPRKGTAGSRRPGVPIPVENIHPFRTGEAIGRGAGAAWCAAALADELRAAGLPRAGRLAGLRPHGARRRARRPHPVGVPRFRRHSTRPSWRWRSRRRPTSSRTSSG